jgi:hypothetical protein
VTISITLYAGGTIVLGPIDITDQATLAALLSSQTLLAQLLATDPFRDSGGNSQHGPHPVLLAHRGPRRTSLDFTIRSR